MAGLPDVLVAGGPDPRNAEALMLFGRFVGEWDLDWTAYGPDGEPALCDRGEWIFGWILEGRAVQDVWIVPARDRRGQDGAPAGEYGTTIRFYDPRRDVWLVTWSGPLNGARRTFVGRGVGDTIVQEGRTEEGDAMHWIFSDITSDSFTWRSISSTDGESSPSPPGCWAVRLRPASPQADRTRARRGAGSSPTPARRSWRIRAPAYPSWHGGAAYRRTT